MKNLLIVIIGCLGSIATAQPKNPIGFELDALPYITGGYYGSVWVGHDRFRYRAVVAKITTPDFFVEDGFSGNTIQAYAGIVDYFFKPDFKGWWIGSGLELWKGQIQTDAKLNTAHYQATVFTLGGGYVWKFYKNFYLNPWVAMHGRISGDKKIPVDAEIYKPPGFVPEASLKIGWHF